MPDPVESYHLEPGNDLLDFGVYATALLQLIKLAVPNTYHGGLIFSETTPAVVGQPDGYPTDWYEWHTRCIWVKPSEGSLWVYNGGWVSIFDAIPDLTITTDMIQDEAITLAKFSGSGASALQIIRRNAANTAFEFVAVADAIQPASVATSKLVSGGAGRKILASNDSVIGWELFDSALILAELEEDIIPVNYLEHGAAKEVPMMTDDGTEVEWRTVLEGIDDYTIPIAKISKVAGEAGFYALRDADGSVIFRSINVPAQNQVTSAVVNIPSDGSYVDVAHGQNGKPQFVDIKMICIATQGGYAVGDEISLSAAYTSGTGAEDGRPSLVFVVNNTYVRIMRQNAATPYIIDRDGSGVTALDTAKWQIRVETLYFS
jgi:hypothetical protein